MERIFRMGWFGDGGCCQNRDLGDFRVPDNRKALDGLWELSIIVPLAAFARAVGAEDCDLLASHAGVVLI